MTHAFRMTTTSAAIMIGLAVCNAPALASDEGERPSHYVPEASETLEQAVDNFVTTSAEVARILSSEPLSVEEMERVHELTYTLEVALAKMNEELAALPEVLEVLHKASEGEDVARFKAAGAAYLDTALEVSP